MSKLLCGLLLVFSAALFADESPEFDPTAEPPPEAPAEQPMPKPRLVKTSQRHWKMARWAGIGYRYDYQKFRDYTSSDQLNSSLVFRSRNTIQVLAGFAFNWNEVILNVRGGYGWMTQGLADFNAPGNNGGYPLAFNTFKIGAGYTADVQGTIGYRIPLVGTRPFAMKLTPSVGYRYAHIMNDMKGEMRSNISGVGFALGRFPDPSQQDWFGPYFEAKLETRFSRNFFASFYYQYALPAMRMVTTIQEDVYTSPGAGLISGVQLYRERDVAHGGALRTQLGGVDLSYQDNSGWRIGLHFEGSKTWSDTSHVYVQRKLQQYDLPPTGEFSTFTRDRLAVEWFQYLTYIHVGYRF